MNLQVTDADLQTIVEALRKGLGEQLVCVVLFGSVARDEATPESDIDLLVIAKGLPDRFLERLFMLKQMLPPDWRGRVSMLVRTPEEFDEHIASLHLDIALDGQILYDPHRYAEQRLNRLRQFLKQSGLKRERTAVGDVWRKEVR